MVLPECQPMCVSRDSLLSIELHHTHICHGHVFGSHPSGQGAMRGRVYKYGVCVTSLFVCESIVSETSVRLEIMNTITIILLTMIELKN
jgi:hypothetical protein